MDIEHIVDPKVFNILLLPNQKPVTQPQPIVSVDVAFIIHILLLLYKDSVF